MKMKKFLISILICAIISNSLFATIEKEQFDEVYDQLVVSNNQLKEVSESYNKLKEKYDKLEQDYKFLSDSYDTVYDALTFSNETLIKANEELSKAKKQIENSNTNLEDSNEIIKTIAKKYTYVEADLILSTSTYGYELTIGREIFLNYSIVGGIQLYNNQVAIKAGIGYKF